MSDTTRMLAWLRETLDAAEQAAQELERWTHGAPFAAFMTDPIIGPFGGQDRIRNFATGQAVARLADPAAVLRRITAERKTIADCTRVLDNDHWGETAYLAEDTILNLAEGWGWTEETSGQ
ncbi:hypothetical protein AAW14_06405 [Streptomyces hygroscopicus]|uniref:DUF6221 family protein n=1 Tax=Streptomyces hygroscopicus TaxID=1912 RepID=UPI00224048DC|nr:DUF6221 family protein [Streptomyces hygroscopicus]MCW7941671.1 hypothetical protein [Streptomyces hygroscopicus]